MIPALDPKTRHLPPGIHLATWDEVMERFGRTSHRRVLLEGLRQAMDALWAAGCPRVYLDGSFVSAKVRPNDFDACWDTAGVDFAVLRAMAPAILDTAAPRTAQKREYGGELLPANALATSSMRYLHFFQTDRDGRGKGIIALDLRDLP